MPNIYSLPQEVMVNVCSSVLVEHPLSLPGLELDKKTLARLARTCRALSGPALTVLWRTLFTILPLLSTLPTDLCAHDSVGTGSNGMPQQSFRLTRTPTSVDFGRWKLYSVLVREIKSLHSTASTRGIFVQGMFVSSEVLVTLGLHGPKPLVPYIQVLNEQTFPMRRYPLEVTRLFFSSTLTSFGLLMSKPAAELVPYVDALAEFAPSLRKLRISWDYGSCERVVPSDYHSSTALSQNFRSFSYLHTLHVHYISILPPALRAMGALPSLQTLEISISRFDYPASWRASVLVDDDDFFPQLRSLFCQVDDLALLAGIIQAVSSPFMDQLRIDSRLAHPASFQALCEVLSRHPSRESLRSLVHAGWLSELCDLNAAFCHLAALPAITDITLRTVSVVMLSDDTLETMARAWPRLERLDLHEYEYRPNAAFDDYLSPLEYQATLRGLNAFAQNCPSLKVLKLAIEPWCEAFYNVDDNDAPGWERDFRPVAPDRSALVTLYVGFMETQYPLQVAGIISAIFPRLRRVGYGEDEGLYRWPGWEETNRVLEAFHLVRTQERGGTKRELPRTAA